MLDNISFVARMQKTYFPEGGSMTAQMPLEKTLNYNRADRQSLLTPWKSRSTPALSGLLLPRNAD